MGTQKKNYSIMLDKTISSLQGKPSLLLHACCAPCASSVLEYLFPYFDITVLFYNPNISSTEEYEKRAGELKRFISEAPFCKDVKLGVYPYDSTPFYDMSRGFETCPERGARCHMCYRMRLEKTAEIAKEQDFDYFTTTLTLSPLKDSQIINETGREVSCKYGVAYLFSDFKKHNGYLRSLTLSSEYGLYRQNFCGCVFSRSKNDNN